MGNIFAELQMQTLTQLNTVLEARKQMNRLLKCFLEEEERVSLCQVFANDIRNLKLRTMLGCDSFMIQPERDYSNVPEELMAENENIQPLEDGTYAVRTYLKLPQIDWSKITAKVYYYVEEGDCLSTISEYFEISISEIVSCNNSEGAVVVSSEGGYTKDVTKKEPCKGEDIYDMFFIKKTMWLMDNPANSIWRISPEITDENIIYAGDFIRIK